MQYTQQQQPKQRDRSVLDGPKFIAGLPSKKKSAVEQARASRPSMKWCHSALDGPQYIAGC